MSGGDRRRCPPKKCDEVGGEPPHDIHVGLCQGKAVDTASTSVCVVFISIISRQSVCLVFFKHLFTSLVSHSLNLPHRGTLSVKNFQVMLQVWLARNYCNAFVSRSLVFIV